MILGTGENSLYRIDSRSTRYSGLLLTLKMPVTATLDDIVVLLGGGGGWCRVCFFFYVFFFVFFFKENKV